MCGIETVIDCVHYIRSKRCDAYDGDDILKEVSPVRVEYAIDKSGFVNPAQVRHVLRYSFIDEFLYFVYPDSYQARVFLRVCPDTQSSCAGIGWHDFLFTLNQVGGDPDQQAPDAAATPPQKGKGQATIQSFGDPA